MLLTYVVQTNKISGWLILGSLFLRFLRCESVGRNTFADMNIGMGVAAPIKWIDDDLAVNNTDILPIFWNSTWNGFQMQIESCEKNILVVSSWKIT